MQKFSKFIKTIIKGAAIVSSNTTSLLVNYQPQKPATLIKEERINEKKA